MPPPETVAKILVPFEEQATELQPSLGADVNVQFWPKAEAAAKQRFPTAAAKKRKNLFFTLTAKPVAMHKSENIKRLSPGVERPAQSVVYIAN
jgi:hypothetical protein